MCMLGCCQIFSGRLKINARGFAAVSVENDALSIFYGEVRQMLTLRPLGKESAHQAGSSFRFI